MRIAHLIDSLDYGGAEQVVVSLAANQARQGNFVRLICLRDLGPNPVKTDALTDAGVEIVCLFKPAGLHLGTLKKLVSYLRANQFDILHTHNHLVHHYGALAGALTRVRTVSTLHGSNSLKQAPSWTKVLYRLSCLMSDATVGVAAEVEQTLKEELKLPPGVLHVVENGIDLAPFLSISRRAPTPDLVFGTIGRLEAVKDHSNLLNAFALVKRRHSGVQLRILGDGSLRESLEQLARQLGVHDCVHFEGFSLETRRFLSNIDVYVISSKSEGLPLTLLEALAAGLPVAATAVGAIPDVISKSKCGSLCPPSNHEELASCMEREIERTRTQDVAFSARAFVAREYGLDRMTRSYAHLYEQIAGPVPL